MNTESSQATTSPSALIHFNDEAGPDQYSVEMADDVGNWIDSFPSMMEAILFIRSSGFSYDPVSGFRDTRYKY
jgi:hypothetical protein